MRKWGQSSVYVLNTYWFALFSTDFTVSYLQVQVAYLHGGQKVNVRCYLLTFSFLINSTFLTLYNFEAWLWIVLWNLLYFPINYAITFWNFFFKIIYILPAIFKLRSLPTKIKIILCLESLLYYILITNTCCLWRPILAIHPKHVLFLLSSIYLLNVSSNRKIPTKKSRTFNFYVSGAQVIIRQSMFTLHFFIITISFNFKNNSDTSNDRISFCFFFLFPFSFKKSSRKRDYASFTLLPVLLL